MPDDDNGLPPKGSANAADVLITLIKAIEDILNDWRVMVTLLVVILLAAGKIAGPEVGAIVEGWIRAWRGQP